MTKPRILVVEDFTPRADQIRTALPGSVHCVCVRTPDGAIDILKRNKFEGILLDYSFGGSQLAGTDVTKVMAETQDRSCEVFVHSDSICGADRFISLLRRSGFHVEHHPWSEANVDCVTEWAEKLVFRNHPLLLAIAESAAGKGEELWCWLRSSRSNQLRVERRGCVTAAALRCDHRFCGSKSRQPLSG